jgi:hypothetical protein
VDHECRGPGIATRSLIVTIEADRLKPQREEGEAAFRTVIGALLRLGVARVVVTTNALTKLQILRIAKEQKARSLIEFTTPSGVPK